MIDWIFAQNCLPEKEGEYFCYVEVPRRAKNSHTVPKHNRYMSLVFAEGGFWIHGGMPQGMVIAWTETQPPPGYDPPPIR